MSGIKFASKKFRPASYYRTFPARYRAALDRYPFALFGLPFIATIVAGSFFLTPATAIRYENHDRKIRTLSREEELGLGQDRRRVDIREEYFRLSAKGSENWEQVRVKRLPGEPDGVL